MSDTQAADVRPLVEEFMKLREELRIRAGVTSDFPAPRPLYEVIMKDLRSDDELRQLFLEGLAARPEMQDPVFREALLSHLRTLVQEVREGSIRKACRESWLRAMLVDPNLRPEA